MFVLGPLVLRVYLMRKISKFRKSREVGGLNFGLWLEKTFWGMMACIFAWCDMNSHLLRLLAVDLEVESMCASICFVLSVGFLKNDWIRRTEDRIDVAFGLFACNCSHCLDYPIVGRVNSVKNFLLLNTMLPTLFLQIITWFYFCQPKL